MKYPNLKLEMVCKGVTQEALAKAVGINPQTIYSWQQGSAPSVDKAFAVSDYLDADVRYLFAETATTSA